MKMLQTKIIDASKVNFQALHNSWHSEVIYRVYVKITWLNQAFTVYINTICTEYLLQVCMCVCVHKYKKKNGKIVRLSYKVTEGFQNSKSINQQ